MYRSTFSNCVKSTPDNNLETISLGDLNGNYLRLAKDKCGSIYFKRFMKGLKSRMVQVTKPNLALSITLIKNLFHTIEIKIQTEEDRHSIHLWKVFLVYATLSYVISLRGPEGFLLDLSGLNKHWSDQREYVIISLFGKIKGEKYDLTHLVPCTSVTQSGINIKTILKNFITYQRQLGHFHGPAISDLDGKLLTTKILDELLHEALTIIYASNKDLFPIIIENPDDIRTHYQCYRTFRRTSTTRAIEMGVPKEDINVVNRWKAEEKAKGKKPNLGMRQHYTQLELLVAPFIRYTNNM